MMKKIEKNNETQTGHKRKPVKHHKKEETSEEIS